MTARNKPAVTAEGLAQSPDVDVHLTLDMVELCSSTAPAAIHIQNCWSAWWRQSSSGSVRWSTRGVLLSLQPSSSPQLALAISAPRGSKK